MGVQQNSLHTHLPAWMYILKENLKVCLLTQSLNLAIKKLSQNLITEKLFGTVLVVIIFIVDNS